MSGAVPLVSRDTAPSEHEHDDARAHHADFRRVTDTAIEDTVSPPRDATNASKPIDASRLSFSMQMLIMVVGVVSAAYGAAWQAQSGLRDSMAVLQSDMRDIRTQMAYQAKLAEKDQQIWQERFEAMKAQDEKDAELRKVLLKQYEQANAEFQRRVLSRQD